MKPTLRSVCALTIVSLSLAASAAAETTPHGEILWDTYGVPHIHGKTEQASSTALATRRLRATATS